MTPAFFVQNNYVERLTAPVALFARDRGLSLEDRSCFEGFDPDQCGIDWTAYDLVLPYGSVQFLRALKASSLAPFVLHDESRFATSAWARAFGPDALNGSGLLASAREVDKILVTDGPCHLRPDSVDKAFHGAVVDSATWAQVREKRRLEDGLLCWVSSPQEILAEWRCWVVGGVVVEISKYREDGQKALERETKQEVFASAQRLADRYLPAPCVVLDMAQVGARQVLIEFNPIHTSGWYAADVGKVLGAWLDWSLREWPLARHPREADFPKFRTRVAAGG